MKARGRMLSRVSSDVNGKERKRDYSIMGMGATVSVHFPYWPARDTSHGIGGLMNTDMLLSPED
jgi:hypothetical protein